MADVNFDVSAEYKKGLTHFGNKEYENAFECWTLAAEGGYAKAMCDVGWMYSQGTGTDKDNTKAFEWMLKSAEKGYVRAQNNIGLYFKNGTGTKVDIRKSVYWLEKAEKAGYPKLAENTLRNCRAILREQKLESDFMVVDAGELTAKEEHKLGMEAFTKKDYQLSFDHWLKAANKGSIEAMCDVGWMYSQGNGVGKDEKQAFEWMEKSAKLGFVRAQNNLGLYYKNGTGCERDVAKTVEWLEKAEKKKYAKLARKTLKEAREQLTQGKDEMEMAKEDYKEGLECFGHKRFADAYDLWLKSARRGYNKAMCDLGWMLSQGHGAPKDEKEAFKWMKRSAELGYARAQNNIGLYYKNGTGTPPDMRKAVEWLEKAEKANYDKLAKKALEEARRIVNLEDAKRQKMIKQYREKDIAKAVQDEKKNQMASKLSKYKAAIHIAMAKDTISEEENRILTKMKSDNNITDDQHEKCLWQLGFTVDDFEERKKTSAQEPVQEKNECVVCLDNVADHCILFCMHICLCKECAESYTIPNTDGKGKPGVNCPKCRGKVEMVKKVFGGV